MAKRLRKTLPKERLSPSEWEIMRLCWRLGRSTVRDILTEDLKAHRRDYRTILTFLTRMARKGWLRVEKQGNTNSYTPAVGPRMALESEIRRFLRETVGEDPEHWRLLSKLVEQAGRKRP